MVGQRMHEGDRPDVDDQRDGQVFSNVAQWASRQCGRASTFIIACLAIIGWAVMGPMFDYSDTWQLLINTGTTIVTFLMVFLIQNTQNRDMSTLHRKLDELIRASQDARNKLLDLDDMTEDELERLRTTFSRLAVERIVPKRGADVDGQAVDPGRSGSS